MSLTIDQIRNAESDEALFRLLQAELHRLLPLELLDDTQVFLNWLQRVPRGIRAMAATYELDVSLAMDDLAWHFVNHPELEYCEETLRGLRELEAHEAAEVFEKALAIMKPHRDALQEIVKTDPQTIRDWLEDTRIQERTDPLNVRMAQLLESLEEQALFHYWTAYARKYPDRCVAGSEAIK